MGSQGSGGISGNAYAGLFYVPVYNVDIPGGETQGDLILGLGYKLRQKLLNDVTADLMYAQSDGTAFVASGALGKIHIAPKVNNVTPITIDGDKIGFNNEAPGVNFDFVGNMQIAGDLVVTGTQFITNAETVEIKDNLLLLNKGEVGAGVTNRYGGIEIDRGTLNNYQFVFDENDDSFKIGEATTLQKVATREDAPLSNSIPFWDATNNRFTTASNMYWETQENLRVLGYLRVGDSSNYATVGFDMWGGEIGVVSGYDDSPIATYQQSTQIYGYGGNVPEIPNLGIYNGKAFIGAVQTSDITNNIYALQVNGDAKFNGSVGVGTTVDALVSFKVRRDSMLDYAFYVTQGNIAPLKVGVWGAKGIGVEAETFVATPEVVSASDLKITTLSNNLFLVPSGFVNIGTETLTHGFKFYVFGTAGIYNRMEANGLFATLPNTLNDNRLFGFKLREDGSDYAEFWRSVGGIEASIKDVMVVDLQRGNISIGKSSFSTFNNYKLEVQGQGLYVQGTTSVEIKNDDGWATIIGQSPGFNWELGQYDSVDETSFVINIPTSNIDMILATNNIPTVTVSSQNYVGIGTTSPQGLLHLFSSSTKFILENSVTSQQFRIIDGGVGGNIKLGTDTNTKLSFVTYGSSGGWGSGVERMTIDGVGNVGIGTVSPVEKLDVSGNIYLSGSLNRYIRFRSVTNWDYYLKGEGDNFRIYDSQSTDFLKLFYNGGGAGKYISILGTLNVKNSGNVGIGTTSPTEKLDVNGNIHISGDIAIGSSVRTNTGVVVEKYVDPADTVSYGISTIVRAYNTNSSAFYYGGSFQAQTLGVGSTANKIVGLYGSVDHIGHATLPTAIGIAGEIKVGYPASGNALEIITNAYNFYGYNPFIDSGGGVITNAYGLYLENITTAINNYAIYTAGSTQSYFGGNVGIGVGSPAEKLDVSGNIHLTGEILFNITTPTNLVLTEYSDYVLVEFNGVATEGNDEYEIWASYDNVNYDLIAVIPTDEIASSMSVKDYTYDRKTTIYYKVYAVRNGFKSPALSGSIALLQNVPEVTGVTVEEFADHFVIQYRKPVDRRLSHVEIWVEHNASNSGWNEANASLVYSGNDEIFIYNIPFSEGDAGYDDYYKFYVKTITRT